MPYAKSVGRTGSCPSYTHGRVAASTHPHHVSRLNTHTAFTRACPSGLVRRDLQGRALRRRTLGRPRRPLIYESWSTPRTPDSDPATSRQLRLDVQGWLAVRVEFSGHEDPFGTPPPKRSEVGRPLRVMSGSSEPPDPRAPRARERSGRSITSAGVVRGTAEPCMVAGVPHHSDTVRS